MLRAIPTAAGPLELILVQPSSNDPFAESEQAIIDVINQLQASVTIFVPPSQGINSYTFLSNFDVTGMNNGVWAYIDVQDSYWQLNAGPMQLLNDEVIPASDGRFWLRVLIPSSRWSQRYLTLSGESPKIFVNRSQGNNLNDGSRNSPIRTKSEGDRRLRYMAAGVGTGSFSIFGFGQYITMSQSDVLYDDTFGPSAIESLGGVSFAEEITPLSIGFRRKYAIVGDNGIMSAAASNTDVTTRAKPTMTNALTNFGPTTVQSGVANGDLDTSNFQTLTSVFTSAGAGFTAEVVGRQLMLSPWPGVPIRIIEFVDANTIVILGDIETFAGIAFGPFPGLTWSVVVDPVGLLVMAADAGTSVSSGVAGVVTIPTFPRPGLIQLVDATASFSSGSVDRIFTFTGGPNAGSYPCVEFINETTVLIDRAGGSAQVGASWTERTALCASILTAPSFTTGTFAAGISAVVCGIATLPLVAGIATSDIGKQFRITTGLVGNRGEYRVVSVTAGVSIDAVRIDNSTPPVVDAGAANFEGVVETTQWVNQETLDASVSPPTGSVYTVASMAIFAPQVAAVGAPKAQKQTIQNFNMVSFAGPTSAGWLDVIQCQMTGFFFGNGTVPNSENIGIQSLMSGFLSTWIAPFKFAPLVLQENAYCKWRSCAFVNYNIVIRELGPQVGPISNCIIQSGSLMMVDPSEGGQRPGSIGLDMGGGRSVGVFNNVEDSDTNNSGTAISLRRKSKITHAGSTGAPAWGIGSLCGLHILEASTLMLGDTAAPSLIADTAGSAGFPVRDVKIDNDAPIAQVDHVYGVPSAAGTATTGVTQVTGSITAVTDGIATLLDAAQSFDASLGTVGRTVTIANSPGNNGTFPVVSVVGASPSTSITYRNPTAVVDLSGVVNSTENPIVTNWTQVNSFPYVGSVTNFNKGTQIVRVGEA